MIVHRLVPPWPDLVNGFETPNRMDVSAKRRQLTLSPA
jgi:hypothetical protein